MFRHFDVIWKDRKFSLLCRKFSINLLDSVFDAVPSRYLRIISSLNCFAILVNFYHDFASSQHKKQCEQRVVRHNKLFSDKVNTYFSFHQIFKSFFAKKVAHMACNARDTPSGYNLSNHWRHPPDSLTTVAPSACLQLLHPWLVHDCFVSLFTAEASFAWLPWQDRRGLQHYLLTRAKHRLRVVRRISLQN